MPGRSLSVEAAVELLGHARRLIRSRTRSPKYWAAGDMFSEMILGKALGTPPDIFKAAGSDLAAVLDSLYEDLARQGGEAAPRLKETTRAVQAATQLETATEVLGRLGAALEGSSASLLDCAIAICAVLTLRGYEELSRGVGEGAAQDWLALWSDSLWKHDSQQEAISRFGVLSAVSPAQRNAAMASLGLAPGDVVPVATTFSDGVREFLTRYGDTGASGMSLVAVLPFSEALTAEERLGLLGLMRAEPDFLGLTTRLLRFAQDVSFDPTEVLNAGVYAVAAERRMSLIELIASGGLSKADLDPKLKEVWGVYSAEAQSQLARLLQRRAGAPGHQTMAALAAIVSKLTGLLVPGTWKPES